MFELSSIRPIGERIPMSQETSSSGTQILGKSPFNYAKADHTAFKHHVDVINSILELKPATILEIGPGEHIVTDYLRRKGFVVDTLDNDLNLHPTYTGDIREELKINKKYDLILASEVFEHMNFRFLPKILGNLKIALAPGGHLLVTLPYSTVRLFPINFSKGLIFSPAGFLNTQLPLWIEHFLFYPAYVLAKKIIRKDTWRQAIKFTIKKEYADNEFNFHHWDLGYWPTTRSATRKVMQSQFQIASEKMIACNPPWAANNVHYLLKMKSS